MRIGFWEIVVVLVVALVLFGPNRLPEMGKALGKAIREFRKYTSELGSELERARQDLEEETAAVVAGARPGNKQPEQQRGSRSEEPSRTTTSESSEPDSREPAGTEPKDL